MRLLIDAGNTRIKWALTESVGHKVIARGILEDGFTEFPYQGISSAWVSCVASDGVLDRLKLGVLREFGVDLEEAKVAHKVAGMLNKYKDLSRLGVDRWVAALGARSIYPSGALIVIDAGTAVTIDLISAENVFEGGVILPGFRIMHDSLLGRTAGISSTFVSAGSVIGRDTQECVNAGVHYGLIGAIEKVVDEMLAQQLSLGNVRVLIMGGDAAKIVDATALSLELQSDMIFQGLALLATLDA